MALRKISFVIDEHYHIYNRGVDKRIIFSDDYDYKRFVMLLYLCNGDKSFRIRDIFNRGHSSVEVFSLDRGEQFVDIGGYCLMPNHFHILLKDKVENGVSMFMEKLSTAYVMYFNTKNERSGSLFEGRFKVKHIDNGPYMNWLFSYIHLNPIKLTEPNWKEKGISDPITAKDFVENYKHSSYSDYFVGEGPEKSILNKPAFPDYFSQLNDLDDLIQEFRENNF